MEKIPFEVVAVLGRGVLSQDSFLQISEGDILVLDQGVSDLLPIEIGGIPQGYGRIGSIGGYKAIKIIEENHEQ